MQDIHKRYTLAFMDIAPTFVDTFLHVGLDFFMKIFPVDFRGEICKAYIYICRLNSQLFCV